MRARYLIVLLMLVPLAYATAPSWVAAGVNLTYSQGSTTNTYYVQSRSGDDITYQLRTVTSTSTRNPTLHGNASADYGDFWFDITLLSGQHTGDTVGDFSVTDESQQTFAGTQYNTISVQNSVQGATITRVIDKATGLVLKVHVDVSGVSDAVLSSRYIPAYDATAPPPSPPPGTPPQQNATNGTATQPPPAPASNGSGTGTQQPPPAPYQPSGSTGSEPISGVQPYSTKSPLCCGSAFILAFIGFAAFLGARARPS